MMKTEDRSVTEKSFPMLLTAILILLILLGSYSVTCIFRSFKAATRSDEWARMVRDTQVELLSQTNSIRDYVLSSEKRDLDAFETSSKRVGRMLDTLAKTLPWKEAQEKLRTIRLEHQAYLGIMEEIQSLLETGDRVEAIDLLASDGVPASQRLLAAADEMADSLDAIIRDHHMALAWDVARIEYLYILTSLGTVLTAFFLLQNDSAPLARIGSVLADGVLRVARRSVGIIIPATVIAEKISHRKTVDMHSSLVSAAASTSRDPGEPVGKGLTVEMPKPVAAPTEKEQTLLDQVTEVMDRHNIPQYIWLPIALRESGLNPTALNREGRDARGLFQIDLGAHPNLAKLNLFDPQVNAETAARKFLAPAYKKAVSLPDAASQAEYVWRHGLKPHWPTVEKVGAVAALRRDAAALAAGEPIALSDNGVPTLASITIGAAKRGSLFRRLFSVLAASLRD